MLGTKPKLCISLIPVIALAIFDLGTARSSWSSGDFAILDSEKCSNLRLRGGSTTPPSDPIGVSDLDPKRLATKTAQNFEIINRGLESISNNPSSPGRTSSPALVISPPASTAGAGSARLSPRQRTNESLSASPSKPVQGESVFQRLYQSSQQREQNLERLRQQQEAKEAKRFSPRTKHAGGGDVFKRLSTTGTFARPINAPNSTRTRSGSRPKPVDWRKVGTPASRGEPSPPKTRPVRSEIDDALSSLQHRELVERCKELQAQVKRLEASEETARTEAERSREELQVMQGRYEQLNSLLDEMSTALEDALDRMRDLQERFPWIAYVGTSSAGGATPPPAQR